MAHRGNMFAMLLSYIRAENNGKIFNVMSSIVFKSFLELVYNNQK